jgi:hypothetical protein
MYSIYFVDPDTDHGKVYITLPTLEWAQHYWDILSNAKFHMISTRP